MTNPYSFAFDGSSKCYLPLQIHARVKLWDPISVDLKPQIEVRDKDGFDWIKSNKIFVIPGSQKLIEAGRAAQFSLGIGSALTLEDIFDSQGIAEIAVSLFPDKMMPVPGSPVPVGVPPVTSCCKIRVPLPAEIETDIDPFLALDQGGVYLSARVNLYLPSRDSVTAQKIRDSITFTQRSGQIVIDQLSLKTEGDWKRVRVYPLPGNEHLVREQNNLVEVKALVFYEELVSTVVLPLDTQALEISIEPQPTLKLNSRDIVNVRATMRFSDAFPPQPADRDNLINSLQLQFDASSASWLSQSSKTVFANGAVWTIKGANQGLSGVPPQQADITVSTSWRGSALSANAALSLLADQSSLELFSNPSPPLTLGDENGLWVYAKVRESAAVSKALAQASTDAIRFSLMGANSQVLRTHDEQSSGDYKTVRVTASLSGGASLAKGVQSISASTTVSGATITETLDLPIEQAFELHAQIGSHSSTYIKFDSQKNMWVLPPIKAWFSLIGGRTPIKSGCALDSSPIKSKYDLLKVQKISTGPVSEVEISLSLDSQRKEFEQLLNNGGKVEVEVTGHSPDGKIKYRASVYYNFEVEYELTVEQVDGDSPLKEPRDYKDLTGQVQKSKLQVGEIVSDGCDRVRLCISSRRKDNPKATDTRGTSTISSATISGVDRQFFELKPEGAPVPPSSTSAVQDRKFYYLLCSKTPLLATRDRLADGSLTLHFELEKKDAQGGKVMAGFEFKASIRPIFLKLWIFPGMKRGMSTAAALACIESSKDGVVNGLECELAVVPEPAREPKLKIEGAAIAKINEKGVGYWTLKYENLSFGNSAQAIFKVRCRPKGSPDCTYFSIDVGQNGKDFLKALDDRARLDRSNPESLDLTNPEFNSDASWLSTADYVIPDDVRGSFYNVRFFYYGDLPGVPIPLYRYTCGELKKRILDFAFKRRFAKDSCLLMNGLEFGDYAIGYLHNFFGFNLSGNPVKNDAWFIDPWWRQRWDSDEVAHTWTTQYWKCFWAVTFVLCEMALLCMFIYVSGRAMLNYAQPSIDRIRSILPDFSKSEYLQRLRQALSAWLGGPEKKSVVMKYLEKAGRFSWIAIKYSLGVGGPIIMLHPRVRLDDAYFSADADYRPTALYKERERLQFEQIRLSELANETSVCTPVEPGEAW